MCLFYANREIHKPAQQQALLLLTKNEGKDKKIKVGMANVQVIRVNGDSEDMRRYIGESNK